MISAGVDLSPSALPLVVLLGRRWHHGGDSGTLRDPAEIVIVPEDERLPDSCLHCEINDVVREYIEQHTPTNLPDLVAKMSESFVELILLGPEEEWGTLLADAIR